MIKGCERRMIKIENTESDLFESAYFIIKQNAQLPKKKRRDDMLREAARIVNDKMEPSGKGKKADRRVWLERMAIFGAGVILSATAAIIIVWLL